MFECQKFVMSLFKYRNADYRDNLKYALLAISGEIYQELCHLSIAKLSDAIMLFIELEWKTFPEKVISDQNVRHTFVL